MRTAKKIGIFGHIGNKNLGDEAIFAAVIQNIRRRCPSAYIYGFTLKPQDTEERHKIKVFPIRRIKANTRQVNKRESYMFTSEVMGRKSKPIGKVKTRLKSIPLIYLFLKAVKGLFDIICNSLLEVTFLWTSYRHLRGIDLLIIAGSQQLIDFIEGSWGHSYTLFKWTILARAARVQVAFVSVGAGPINTRLGKIFIKISLKLSQYCSFRDESSKRAVEQLGISSQNSVFPDLVYSLELEKVPDLPSPLRGRSIVGINPVPFCDPEYWPGSNMEVYEKYVTKLADFACWLTERGLSVLFFPTQLKLDPPVINDIMKIIRNNGKSFDKDIIDWPIKSFDDLLSAVSAMKIVVATRFHGVVIPSMLNKPVLGIAYHEKTFDLMTQIGQREYALDIFSFDLGLLKERFISLESQHIMIGSKAMEKIEAHRKALDVQYDQVLGLIQKKTP